MPRTATAAGLVLAFGLALAADEAKPVALFNGKDLAGWKTRPRQAKVKKDGVDETVDVPSAWAVGRVALDEKDAAKLVVTPVDPAADGGPAARVLANAQSGLDLVTEAKFGDCLVELEVLVPKGSNSGVYLMGEYEVQVFDSWGKEKVGTGDMGGIYNTAAPKVNACRKPGEWQTLSIDFRAPRFDGQKKTADARFVKVVLNEQVIHEDVDVKGPTPSCLTGKEAPTGPLMFQGDHGPVAFRNVRVTPKGKN